MSEPNTAHAGGKRSLVPGGTAPHVSLTLDDRLAIGAAIAFYLFIPLSVVAVLLAVILIVML